MKWRKERERWIRRSEDKREKTRRKRRVIEMDALERIGPRERGPREKRIVEVRPPPSPPL